MEHTPQSQLELHAIQWTSSPTDTVTTMPSHFTMGQTTSLTTEPTTNNVILATTTRNTLATAAITRAFTNNCSNHDIPGSNTKQIPASTDYDSTASMPT